MFLTIINSSYNINNYRIIDSKSIQLSEVSRSDVISFDVTPAIERLSQNNFKENHGMLVQCVTESGSQTNLLNVFDFESIEKPLLLVYTDDGTSKNYVTLTMYTGCLKSSAPAIRLILRLISNYMITLLHIHLVKFLISLFQYHFINLD